MNNSIPPISHTAIQKAEIVWKACMNINPSIYNGSQILAMVNGYGGFPMISPNWNGMSHSLGFIMGQMSVLHAVDTFISPYTGRSTENSSCTTFYIDYGP